MTSGSDGDRPSSVPQDDIPTKVPCPECKGTGKRLMEAIDGKGAYRSKPCLLCRGSKSVGREELRAWNEKHSAPKP